jgi:NAD(P)-dependent dehydrogenase (short-subunit alcohol dehydrogenase family)
MATAGKLEGKRAFITGAASGIGRATAIRFGREGARLALFDRNGDGLRETAELICAAGPADVRTQEGSVAAEADVSGAVSQAVEAFGGLDAVIGVAGIELYAEGDTNVHELELAVWQRTMDTNLTGMFLTLKHGIKALLDSGGGAVVVTGSPTGLFGFAAGETAYSASKAGCHGLARVCATEYAAQGIRVNVVVPGFIDTPLNHPFMDDEAAVADAVRGIPLGRPGRPEEVAGMIAWLASDDASYATGGFYMVDGGQTSV